MKTIAELYSLLREDENRKIRSRAKSTGGSDFMRNRVIVRDKDKIVVSESSILETISSLGRIIGFDIIAASEKYVKKEMQGLSQAWWNDKAFQGGSL